MSCYLRHLEDVLLAAGIRHTRESRERFVSELRERWRGQSVID